MTTGNAARIWYRCRVWSCPPRARGGGLRPSQLSSPAAPAVSSASGARRARRASSPPVVLVATGTGGTEGQRETERDREREREEGEKREKGMGSTRSEREGGRERGRTFGRATHQSDCACKRSPVNTADQLIRKLDTVPQDAHGTAALRGCGALRAPVGPALGTLYARRRLMEVRTRIWCCCRHAASCTACPYISPTARRHTGSRGTERAATVTCEK